MIQPKDITEEAASKFAEVRKNVAKGLRALLYSVTRMFVEAWIVQLIWNNVIIDYAPITEISYWDMFLIMLAVRILTGQIKVGGVKIEAK